MSTTMGLPEMRGGAARMKKLGSVVVIKKCQ